jgi:hypothetical protein
LVSEQKKATTFYLLFGQILSVAFFILFPLMGLLHLKKWTAKLLGASTIILISALVGLFYHINSGGIYETKTIGAMIFRISVTIVFAIIAYFTITKKKL